MAGSDTMNERHDDKEHDRGATPGLSGKPRVPLFEVPCPTVRSVHTGHTVRLAALRVKARRRAGDGGSYRGIPKTC